MSQPSPRIVLWGDNEISKRLHLLNKLGGYKSDKVNRCDLILFVWFIHAISELYATNSITYCAFLNSVKFSVDAMCRDPPIVKEDFKEVTHSKAGVPS